MTWNMVAVLLAGVTALTGAYLWIVKLMLDSRLLRMKENLRGEFDERYACREVFMTRLKAIEDWLGKLEARLTMWMQERS